MFKIFSIFVVLFAATHGQFQSIGNHQLFPNPSSEGGLQTGVSVSPCGRSGGCGGGGHGHPGQAHPGQAHPPVIHPVPPINHHPPSTGGRRPRLVPGRWYWTQNGWLCRVFYWVYSSSLWPFPSPMPLPGRPVIHGNNSPGRRGHGPCINCSGCDRNPCGNPGCIPPRRN